MSRVSVKLSRKDLTEALVALAAVRSGTAYPLLHTVELNGSVMMMGGDGDENHFCTVTLEHLDNFVPLKR